MTPGTRLNARLMNLGVLSTFLALIPTAYIAWICNSAVLIADFLRCSADFVAIFISALIMRKVIHGEQTRYNYGFGKLEQLSSLFVGCALSISFGITILVAVHRVVNPTSPQNLLLGLGFAFLSVTGNAFLWRRNASLLSEDSSPLLVSQERMFAAKTLASLVVFVSLGLTLTLSGWHLVNYVDPLGSLVVAFFILRSAYSLLSSSLDVLLDRSLEEAYRIAILKVLVELEEQFRGFQGIRSRHAGKKAYIEVYLEFAEDSSMRAVQNATDLISAKIEAAIPESDVIVIPQCAH